MADLTLLSFGPEGWGDELLAGLQVTVLLALATAPVGLVGGFALALARRSRSILVRAPADAFATVFKGLPELLTLFLVYYGGQMLLQAAIGLFVDGYVEVSAFLAGVIALGVVSASFTSEVFMGALNAIPTGQREAGTALGLSRVSVWRLVIAPQLLKIALPGLGNLWLVLLKDTALVSVIALPDLLRQTSIAVGVTKDPFLFYGAALAIYLALSIVSMIAFGQLERRLGRGTTLAGTLGK